MYDIIIKNCRLFDGERFSDGLSDIAVADGVLSGIFPHGGRREAKIAINARGAILSPGFIDMHAHVYPLAELGVHPESAFFPFCVTSAADAGSAGSDTLVSGLEGLAACRADIKCFLNISPAGLATLRGYPEYIDPKYINKDKIRRLFARFPDRLAGLKVRLGNEVARELGVAPLAAAAEFARELGVRLMVHTTNPPVSMEEICSYLAPGDILSHAFHGHGMTIIGEDGRVRPGVRAAKERGVVFDIGDAGWHFSFDTLRAALADGIAPDTVSTDLTDNGAFKSSVFCLPMVMMKLLALGLPLEAVLRGVTSVPGGLLGLPGRLTEGETADLAVFRLEETDLELTDGNRSSIPATSLIRPLMTVKNGAVVWRDITF